MAAKKSKQEVPKVSLRNRDAFNHLSREERFLLFLVPALGSTRAAKCVTLDVAKAEAVWREFSGEPSPVNLH